MTQQASAARVERRPAFHLAPVSGWINDPNGPLLYQNTYHLFYQHVPDSPEWRWGLVWGHTKSQDLVTWQHLPVALQPTPGGLDQHGCFSGCATLDVDGRPTLLLTGVIRKAPHEIVPGVSPQHESQLIAVATDLDDPDLTHWQKLPGAFLPHPPADMDLVGWRDPFVLERPTASSPWWYVMVGAGVGQKCGTALVYRSRDLTEGWEYVGPLCESPDSFMWECPTLATLTNVPPTTSNASNGSTNASNGSSRQQRHMLSVSPDYCVNGIQYWLGDYAAGRFDMQGAAGPFALDLGDVLYAPQLLTDKQGRTVLWGWMQEKGHMRPPAGATPHTSACCLCVPRVLYLSADGSTLLQEPLPELRQLRQQQGAWHAGTAAGNGSNGSRSAGALLLAPGEPLQLGGPCSSSSSSSVDVELQVAKGGADSFALLLQPFASTEGATTTAGAAITYSWATHTLQVVYSTDLAAVERVAALPLQPRPHYRQPGPSPEQVAAAEAAAAAEAGTPVRCGGALRGSAAADTFSLRILMDGSCLEVFTGTGEALGTRVYRGDETVVAAVGATGAGSAWPAGTQAAGGGGGGTTVGWEQPSDDAAAADDSISSNGNSSAVTAPAAGGGGQIELVAFGSGPAHLLSASAWHMAGMWQQQEHVVATTTAAAAVLSAATAVVLPVGEDELLSPSGAAAGRQAVAVEAA